MKQDTRTEVDAKGRVRTLVRSSCACCSTCWVYADTKTCIYGGPFNGYVVVNN